MNKIDLITAVANQTGLKQADAAGAIDCTLSAIIETLKEGNEVRLVAFGTFSVRERSASEGRNPQTGETIQSPPSRQTRFKAGKATKDALN